MNTHQLETMVKAEHTAQHWLRTVADRLRTPNLDYAHRLLRAWMHAIRDQLPVRQSMRLAAQLPELLRGLYYEGWEPDGIPIKPDADSFIGHFAREARISVFEVWHGAPVVSAALHSLLSPGHLEQAFAELPPQVRALVEPIGGLSPSLAGGPSPVSSPSPVSGPSSVSGGHHRTGGQLPTATSPAVSDIRALPVPRPRQADNPVSNQA